MNKNDIYWAEIKYEDVDGEKTRPALVIGSSKDTVSVLKITSQGSSSAHQYEIIEWEKAGLSRPSYISYEPKIILPAEMIGDRIGTLQSVDRLRFEMRLIERL